MCLIRLICLNRTSKFRDRAVWRLSRIKKPWLVSLWSSSIRRIVTTWRPCRGCPLILNLWLTAWWSSLKTWDRITVISLSRSSKNSIERELTFWIRMMQISKLSSRNTKKLRTTTPTVDKSKSSNRLMSSRMSWVKMLTNKQSRKLSLKLRCKFLRTVWRTWRPSTDSMKKSFSSTWLCLDRDQLYSPRPRRLWRRSLRSRRRRRESKDLTSESRETHSRKTTRD